MQTCRRCYQVPEEKVQYIPYTTCRMVPEERCQTVKCHRIREIQEQRTCQVPYTTCRMVQEEHCSQVPVTTCHLEPYCVKVKVYRQVPVCEPVCEPTCPPACPPAPCCPDAPISRGPNTAEWYARVTDRALRGNPVVQASATGK